MNNLILGLRNNQSQLPYSYPKLLQIHQDPCQQYPKEDICLIQYHKQQKEAKVSLFLNKTALSAGGVTFHIKIL